MLPDDIEWVNDEILVINNKYKAKVKALGFNEIELPNLKER